jgi:hypothetical protein
MFMLSLEVVGPGGSLSTVLIATPYWQVGESPGRRHQRQQQTVATGRQRRFFFGWGAAGGGDSRAAPAFDGSGLKICYICSFIRFHLAFFIRYIRPFNIRPT